MDMLLAAYLGDLPNLPPEGQESRLDWDELPDYPTTRALGAIVHLVCHVEGSLAEVNEEALQEIYEMESVMGMEVYEKFLDVGNNIEKTVDIRSDSGWVHLANDDAEQFQRDYNRIVELMPQMFSVVETLG
mmetsp:Transcript_4468/g.6776  ORF Transcript_4468/g.6776 Transcript_4468/m.6776 type:complete len:131 (+) Transcript_4468:441-833(+)